MVSLLTWSKYLHTIPQLDPVLCVFLFLYVLNSFEEEAKLSKYILSYLDAKVAYIIKIRPHVDNDPVRLHDLYYSYWWASDPINRQIIGPDADMVGAHHMNY